MKTHLHRPQAILHMSQNLSFKISQVGHMPQYRA